MAKTIDKNQKIKIEQIIEASSLLTPTEAFESIFKAMGVEFIDCTPPEKLNRKITNSKN
jgi:hypothetical protein